MQSHLHPKMYLGLALSLSPLGCGRAPAPLAPAIEAKDIGHDLESVQRNYSTTDFPTWRNVDQDGVESARDVPIEWSSGKNVIWSADVPGVGHSSPVLCSGRVFLTSSDEARETQSVVAFDATSGEKIWERTVHTGGLPPKHGKNSHASSTPACDAQRVYAAFVNHSGLHVTALDSDGELVWQREVGPFESEHGYGSSVVLWKGLLLVNGDSQGNGYVAAVNRETGEVVWRTPRPGSGRHGNYSTPVACELAGRDQLILAGFDTVTSYDPFSGRELWHIDGPTEVMANTPAVRDPFVVVSGGYPEEEILCIRADGTGNVTETHVEWRASRNVSYVPSPTIFGDNVYCVTDDGVLACYSMASGQMKWQERLGGDFSASPLVVGGRFYLPNESGDVFVFQVEPQYKLLAKNRLDDRGGMASLAISGERLFLRTRHKLYCLGHPQELTDGSP